MCIPQMTITILSLMIGVLGFVATLVGIYFTYISFVNPIGRFWKYLRDPDNWEKVSVIEDYFTVYRHKKHPGYQIIIDWDKPVVKNYQEDWIRDYPNREHNSSYFVKLEANGIFLMKELFVWMEEELLFPLLGENWKMVNWIIGMTRYRYS